MNRLDDLEHLRRLDRERMEERIRELPDQLLGALRVLSSWEAPAPPLQEIQGVLVLGMGGSAMGGDLAAGLLHDILSVPLSVHRGYGLPAWVDPHTLVIASSYSGNTEEVLSGFQAALRRGVPLVALTTGGQLGETAESRRVPVLRFEYPSQPRAALGYSFTLILGILWKVGLMGDLSAEVNRSAEFLRRARRAWEPEVQTQDNPAKQLALDWEGRFPVLFAAEHLSPVARRWTTQLNENSKQWAMWAEIPELNHNVIVGLPHPQAWIPGIRVLSLKSPNYHSRVKARFQITGRLLEQAGIGHREIETQGENRLEELLWATLLGDYVSLYLSVLNEEDPTPVSSISLLKSELSRLG